MKRNAVSLVGIIVDPFMGYIVPQSKNPFSSTRNGSVVCTQTFNSEKLCMLVFVLALAFIAVISPVLCFRSLFIKLQLEELWYFWLITISEIGYFAWLVIPKKEKK